MCMGNVTAQMWCGEWIRRRNVYFVQVTTSYTDAIGVRSGDMRGKSRAVIHKITLFYYVTSNLASSFVRLPKHTKLYCTIIVCVSQVWKLD